MQLKGFSKEIKAYRVEGLNSLSSEAS